MTQPALVFIGIFQVAAWFFGLMMYLLPVGSRHYGVGLEFRDFTSAARFHLFLRLLKAATTIPSRAQAHILTQNVDDGSVLCSRIEMPSF